MPELKKEVKDMEPYKPKTDEEIKRIAMEIFHGRIVTDRHIPPGQTQLVISVFMPLAIGGKKVAEWMEKNHIDMIYGETKDTFGRSVNGFPIFSAMGFLDKEDTKKVWDKHDQIKEVMDKV